MPTRVVSLVVALLVAFVSVAGCSGADTRRTSARPTPSGSVLWEACQEDALAGLECARLKVPVDHFAPAGPSIDLALARRAARDRSSRIGSLLVNPGGPGASGVEALANLPLDEAVAERFDLVSWDPRGVGRSAALRCGGTFRAFVQLDLVPDDAAEEAQVREAAEGVSAECAETDGGLLAHLGTVDVAQDLELIRLALGEAKLTYVGLSYGTLIGQLYAERFPAAVRAMVLDGVVDPAQDLREQLTSTVASVSRSLDALLASCGPSCPTQVDPATALRSVLGRVETDPLPDATGQRRVGPTQVLIATVFATYDASLWPSYLQALGRARSGEGAGLARLFDTYLGLASFSANLAVTCVDLPTPQAEAYDAFARSLAPASPVLPELGLFTANLGLPCASWPVQGVTPPHAVRAEGAAPILVLGNTGDNVTPYENSVTVAEALERAALLTYRGQGHLSQGRSDCVDDAVTAYLVELRLPEDGATC